MRSVLRYMNIENVAQLMIRNGLHQTDVSMFPEDEQKQIYARAGEEFLRLNKIADGIFALERAGRLPVDMLRKMAQSKLDLREYPGAYELFKRIGDIQMAEFIKENFL